MIEDVLSSSRAEQDLSRELAPDRFPTFAEAALPPRPQHALMSEMPLPLCRTFYPLGYRAELLTNNEEVLAAAQESFGHRTYLRAGPALTIRVSMRPGSGSSSPAEPTRRQYNHLYSLAADAENQAVLDLHSYANFTWVTEQVVQHRLYFRNNFLEKVVYLLLGASVVTDLHAACVSKGEKGILLCGNSGAGKSTLAYGCARAGWTYTSDDTSYLINDSAVPRVIGHAHRVRFRPAARELFPELKEYGASPRLEGKPSLEVPISELPVQSTAAEAPVHFVVYLLRSSAAIPKLVPLPRGTATKRLCAELYSAGEIRAKHSAILETFANIPAYDLHYSDLDRGMEMLEHLTRVL